jgi:hypothetical protein
LLTRDIATAQEQLTGVQTKLKELGQPLQELQRFKQIRRAMDNPANVRLLRSLIQAVQAIDGDHPAIEPYLKFLK